LAEQAGGAAGAVPWSFSAPDYTFDYLREGQTATLTYVVEIADGEGGTPPLIPDGDGGIPWLDPVGIPGDVAPAWQYVTITVTGTDDDPVIVAGDVTGSVVEQPGITGSTATLSAMGSISLYDVEDDSLTAHVGSVVASGNTAGLPDNATLAALLGVYQAAEAPSTFRWYFFAQDRTFDYLAAGEEVVLSYFVKISDGEGAMVFQTIDVTITGSNDTPTATAKSGFTTDNWTALTVTGATLLAGGTDPDTADTLTLASVQGAVGGTVALTGGNAVFTPTASAVGPASFTYTVSDGHSGTSTATVNLTTTLHQTNGTAGADTLTGATKSAQIDGLAGNDTITAGSAGDKIVGGAGNDTLAGGAGIDTFVYHSGFGVDVINGFTATGAAHDILQVDSNLFSDWAHLLGATQQVGTDLVITYDASDTITLKNVALSSFTSANATFV
jgi:VCBS repeat-containing protein